MQNKITLAYWGFRGFGQVSRLLLAYSGLEWENKSYTDRGQWFGNDKANSGFDFPNLPHIIDGDFKLTQTSAIERYIIEKSENKDLLGKNIQDHAKVNQILGVIVDIRTNSVPLFFDKEYEGKLKGKWDATIKPKLDNLQKFIGNKQFALGYLTLADFYISQYMRYIQKLYPQEFKNYPEVQRVSNNFNNLEKIKQYYAREDSVKEPHLTGKIKF